MKTLTYEWSNAVDALVGTKIKAWSHDPEIGFDSIEYTPIDDGYILPTKSELDAQATVLQSESDALEYSRNRQEEYPDWGSQLNKIYDDGIDAWKTDMVDPVKAKFPKP